VTLSPGEAGRSLPPRVRFRPPGEASRELARRLGRVETRNVTHLSEDFPVFWSRARGAHVEDADGNRYVDLTAGFGVASLGHRHPAVEEAVRRQAGELVHGMGDVHPPEAKVRLLEALAEAVPVDDPRITLGTSGSEAVEIALKTARLFTGKPGVLAFTGAYHGLSYGALAVTDGERFRGPFESQLNPHVRRAPFPHPFRPPTSLGVSDPVRLRDAALGEARRILEGEEGEGVGAVLVEPLQGRGGEVVPPDGFLAGLAELCRRTGRLLVLDEIYTGFGRAGAPFACEREGVTPDLLCLGKSFAGGMPLSACVGRREVMEAWPASRGEALHTSTFLGHPVACAAGTAALALFREEGLAERARELGAEWRSSLSEALSDLPLVGEVRGEGLMVGIDLVRDGDPRRPAGEAAGRALGAALRRGWVVLAGGPEGNVLSLSPPLTVPRELLGRAVAALRESLLDAAGPLSATPPGR